MRYFGRRVCQYASMPVCQYASMASVKWSVKRKLLGQDHAIPRPAGESTRELGAGQETRNALRRYGTSTMYAAYNVDLRFA
jgi:hypothetical protein